MWLTNTSPDLRPSASELLNLDILSSSDTNNNSQLLLLSKQLEDKEKEIVKYKDEIKKYKDEIKKLQTHNNNPSHSVPHKMNK